MIYGFIVAAFLIIDLSDQSQMIPFATMEACLVARDGIRDEHTSSGSRRINCFTTGAKP